jgi:iron(III) transport system ATP-binding protein
LARGDIGCLLGPSGCGKTTALRCIAGFEPVQSGEIRIAGDVVSRPGTLLAAEKRRIGMVFQDYALFAHLTVAGNVGFGLTDRHQPAGKARVDELLALVGLAAHAQKYPHQLSGGQQQRVALARALAPRPRLILMDEPFSNLDVELRERLSIEVRDILKREATTALIVTHDQNEAFSLADWVGVMHQGCIQQWDTPYNLYHQPANRFVADFVGQGAMLTGDVLSSQQVRTELGVLDGQIPLDCNAGAARAAHATAMSMCCCARTISCTTTTARCRPKWRTRPFAVPTFSTPSNLPAASARSPWCRPITTTPLAKKSASSSQPTMWWRFGA